MDACADERMHARAFKTWIAHGTLAINGNSREAVGGLSSEQA